MSADVQTEIIPSQVKKKLVYTLTLLFFGSLLLALCPVLLGDLLFSSVLKNQGSTGFAMIWLGILFAPASPLTIFILVPKSLLPSLLISLLAAVTAIPIFLWWLSLVKDEWTYCWYVIRPVFVWIWMGFCFTAFSIVFSQITLGGV